MIRTVITPDKQDIHIAVPANYIGKQVEIIAFTVDDISDNKIEDKTYTHFASQDILAKDWLTPEEDVAWKDL